MATPSAGGVAQADLHVYQGSDYPATVEVFNEDGSAADLTGYTAKAQVRRDIADKCADVAAEIVVNIQPPLIHLSIPREVTETLCGRYVWDLDLIDSAGAVTTIMAGKVIVTQEVTRATVMTVGA
jgi:hypothetical protein